MDDYSTDEEIESIDLTFVYDNNKYYAFIDENGEIKLLSANDHNDEDYNSIHMRGQRTIDHLFLKERLLNSLKKNYENLDSEINALPTFVQRYEDHGIWTMNVRNSEGENIDVVEVDAEEVLPKRDPPQLYPPQLYPPQLSTIQPAGGERKSRIKNKSSRINNKSSRIKNKSKRKNKSSRIKNKSSRKNKSKRKNKSSRKNKSKRKNKSSRKNKSLRKHK